MKAAGYEKQGAVHDVLSLGEMDGPKPLGPEVSRKCEDSVPDVMNRRNRVSICTLIIGLAHSHWLHGDSNLAPCSPGSATNSHLKRRQNSPEPSTSEGELKLRIGKNFGLVKSESLV
jgi:hypothetical protein